MHLYPLSDSSVTPEETTLFHAISEKTRLEIQKEFLDSLFAHQEQEIRHNPYDQELREMAGIRNGNLEQLKASWAESHTGESGRLAKTPLRHSKNQAIVLVSIASRAAIAGGILPEIAYSLSDIYIRKIEDTASPQTAFQLGRQAEYHYTQLVNDFKTQKTDSDIGQNSNIIQCKNYIFSHLHEKISLADIAQKLYLNKNYLCDLFRKKEGITIGEYILQQKIHSVQNMLIYSDYTYSEIASYFGFSSQSHLGRQFKRITGMTLHSYREAYAKKR